MELNNIKRNLSYMLRNTDISKKRDSTTLFDHEVHQATQFFLILRAHIIPSKEIYEEDEKILLP